MVEDVRVSPDSDVPIYRQIVTQLTFLIESGGLPAGHVLPSARLLAGHLRINRNTVARAYADLTERGLVEGRGRTGTVVVGPDPDDPATEQSVRRDEARQVLEAAVRRSVALGLSATEVEVTVARLARQAERDRLRVAFVECNADRASYFASEIGDHLEMPVATLVLGECDLAAEPVDLLLTTFFHLAEVRGLVARPGPDVVGLVVAPHVQTLVQIAAVPKRRKVGIRYSTEEQAASLRDSLTDAGLRNVVVLEGTDDAALAEVDLVVVPSETPSLREGLDGRVKVIDYGNVLDASSLRMVSDVVRDMQDAKNAASG